MHRRIVRDFKYLNAVNFSDSNLVLWLWKLSIIKFMIRACECRIRIFFGSMISLFLIQYVRTSFMSLSVSPKRKYSPEVCVCVCVWIFVEILISDKIFNESPIWFYVFFFKVEHLERIIEGWKRKRLFELDFSINAKPMRWNTNANVILSIIISLLNRKYAHRILKQSIS